MWPMNLILLVPLCLQLVKDYVDSGRLEKEVDFSVDDKILAAVQG
jgi:hypothetical protein